MEAIFPKCGERYYGWTLNYPLQGKCGICGTDLEVFDDREHIEHNRSPYEYLKYEVPTNKTKEENKSN